MSKTGIIILLLITVIFGGLILPVAGYEDYPDAGSSAEEFIECNITVNGAVNTSPVSEPEVPDADAVINTTLPINANTTVSAIIDWNEPVATFNVTGKIVDATTGYALEGALISVGGINASSDMNGEFTITNISTGRMSVEFTGTPLTGDTPLDVSFFDMSSASSQELSVTLDGYIDLVYNIECSEGSTVFVNPVLMPAGKDYEFTAVLTWGENPSDLDSWLLTPEIDGSAYKVYYGNKGSLTEVPYAQLDVDDTSSFGPETMTINRSSPGTYRYTIHWFSGSGNWTTAGATVTVYQHSDWTEDLVCTGTYYAPQSPLGDDSYWEVLEYDGTSKAVTPINRITTERPTISSSADAMAASDAVNTLKADPSCDAGTAECTTEYITTEDIQPDSSAITSWEWDFGDRTPPSHEQNPTHTYSKEGMYDVTLSISDGESISALTKFSYIAVTASPVITSVTPSSGENTGTVIAEIEGTYFDSDATVTLVRSDGTEISGTDVVVDDFVDEFGTHISCTFDLTDARGGDMIVVVTNPDGKTGESVGGFTIVDIIPPELLSFTSTSPDGEYGIGSTIDITAKYNEELKSGSSVTLSLNTDSEITLETLSFSEINPVSVGRISGDTLRGPAGVFVDGDHAYVTSMYGNTLTIIDISNPENPLRKGSISNERLNGAFGVYVSGDYAYVTGSESNYLEIIDVSNPASPAEVGSFTSSNLEGATGVFVSGNYAYVTSWGGNTLEVIDIFDPANPVEAGFISNDNLSDSYDVFVDGDYAYVPSYDAGVLAIIDISHPENPVEAGNYSTENVEGASCAFVSGDYAYVTSMETGTLAIINISDPANPEEAGSISNENLEGAFGVSVSGDYAYVACMYSDTFEIIDISDLAHPMEAASLSSEQMYEPIGVSVSGNHVYVTCIGTNNLEIIELGIYDELSGSYIVEPGLSTPQLNVESIVSQHAEDPLGNINSQTTVPPINIADESEIAVDGEFASPVLIPPQLTPANQDIMFIAGWEGHPDYLSLDFGDGTAPYTSSTFGDVTSVNINHTYVTPDTEYTVVLTLSLDGVGEQSVSTIITIIQQVPEKIADETSALNIPGAVITMNGGSQQILVNESRLRDSGGDAGMPDNVLTVVKSDMTLLKIETEDAPVYQNGNYTGNITRVTMIPPAVNATIGGDIGTAAVDFSVTMGDYQSEARIETSISKDIADDAHNAFTLACPEMDEIAYTVYFTKSGFTNYSSIQEATINFSAKTSWVNSIGGNDCVRIIRWLDDGTSVSYTPTFVGISGENSIFQVTTDGFSVYGMVSVPPAASPSVSSGSGGSKSNTGVGLILDLTAGEQASVSLDNTAFTDVTIWPSKGISEFMVTVEKKFSIPQDIELNASVYEYDFAKLYKAEVTDLSKIVYTFRMPKQWLEANNAVPGMLYYNEQSGKWNDLLVNVTGENDEYIFSDTEAPGFGWLAIVGNDPSGISDTDGTLSVAEEITPQVTPAPKETGSEPTSQPTPAPFFVVIPAIGMSLAFYLKRK
ncbi:PKD domain-containing protein [Methanogenium marinum]|uniref:PKD domain-containing protein n=1 Tax=Methanogenium marinum TaxID=348610 RepID=A0A9Q4KP80_9EURY|nr:PKD domain-containing protein [Methanogenium marinum]MDE4907685.1 PKD domain-containing protein [Methanogenium marinum]